MGIQLLFGEFQTQDTITQRMKNVVSSGSQDFRKGGGEPIILIIFPEKKIGPGRRVPTFNPPMILQWPHLLQAPSLILKNTRNFQTFIFNVLDVFY